MDDRARERPHSVEARRTSPVSSSEMVGMAKMAVVLALLVPAVGSAKAAPSSGGRIQFMITTQHAQGRVRCGLYARAEDWLTRRYVRKATARIFGRTAVCTFRDVEPGQYAASAYHDENNNGELDRNFIGIPSEAFAFSQGAKAGLGPPSFTEADFAFAGGLLRIQGQM